LHLPLAIPSITILVVVRAIQDMRTLLRLDGEAVMSNPAKNDSYFEFLCAKELIQNEFIFLRKKRRELVISSVS
jgi:hypothetical protein